MNSKKRRALLVNDLKKGQINVEEMAQRFDVSASTIRRDLQFLEMNGHIQRTYGGAILAHAVPEISFIERMKHHGDKKQSIAQLALDFIRDGDTIILDAGSTICALGKLLVGRKLRIITNNLMLIPIFENATNLELIILGGKCRHKSMGTFGPIATEALDHMTADLLFTSADGVVAEKGLCEASLEQTILKSAMIKRSADVFVLADSTKINRLEQHAWTKLPAHWTLITDNLMDDQTKIQFEKTGAKVFRSNI